MTPAILVVEANALVRRALRSAIGGQGYRVFEAATVAEGITAFLARSPLAILLALELPDGDGLDLVTRVRESSEVPILVLSERTEEREPVRALDGGANDYLTKPFREAELLARLRAALRTARQGSSQGGALTQGALRILPLDRRVLLHGREISLTPTEFDLLRVLAREAGHVVPHAQLLRAVWGPECREDIQYLRVFVGHLRRKLEVHPAQPRLILTIPGVGYRLRTAD